MSEETINASQNLQYFQYLRADVLAVIPPTAKRVLSVGCGAGRTEAELVKRGIKVVGVEINSQAAEIARQRGLIVLEGDASKVDVEVAEGPYDCLIYADILEHLPDPVTVLKKHLKNLKANGIVYVSVPNFRHYSVFWQLFVRGRIDYMEAGILDHTHVRITTRKMVLKWFAMTGIRPVNFKYLMHRRRDKWISAILFGLATEFIATQLTFVGCKFED